VNGGSFEDYSMCVIFKRDPEIQGAGLDMIGKEAL